MYLLEAVNFCSGTAFIWEFVGQLLRIFKIVIPILVIIFGMIDLGKAVVASKDDEIKKAAKSLGFRAAAAVLIFFIPSLVGFVISLAGNFFTDDVAADYEICRQCIVSPSSCPTTE